VDLTIKRLETLKEYIYLNDLQDMIFCPETMGKQAQIGTVEEITEFCKIDPVYIPCIDFGHINAREQGSLKTVEDYKERLSYMIAELGKERMKHFHVHFSKIMYSVKGEIKHLTFEDDVYGPWFEPLAIALKELDLQPYIVSESAGTQAEDAKAMQDIYNKL
jgi:deoxyribonuclease-4